ncbi:ATP-binding cassette domain-containing protein [Actinomyces sp. oral taxon 171]|uniref:ATP-binding cassette domain-containing protein n=1 Tax=Actinomyces sp. oral taxon 171 TaxID=706438 RepID=UPI0010FBE7BB|nr:excinuclease ABC subunit UvrA [Actinomyces sp. oral taxon 171]QCT33186.1 excinuclease ABC subunit UvrA [Actinomyces sp. oral taxon 171 str. F0337]
MTTGGRTAEQNPADAHDVIRVVGARENNLRDIDVVIPKRRLTVFTGVSGSGKSSLVFATIAAESRRLVNETYPAFVQGFMEASARPAVDRLEGLTAAITVDQERLGANPRSTLGTVSDVGALLRVLYSTHGAPHIGSPQAFAFNVPSVTGGGAVTTQRGGRKIVERKTFTVQGGMCPRCEGMGRVSDIDLTQVLDETLSLKDGAITVPGYAAGGWQVRSFTESGLFPADVPVDSFTPKQRDDLLYKEPTKIKVGGINTTYEGLVPRIRKSMLAKEPEALQPHIRAFVERAVVFGTCPQCQGTRLSEPARTCLIDGKSIADACTMQISDLLQWVTRLQGILTGAAPLLENLKEMLDAFVLIGLGYLSLDRPASTLSGGEAQRTKLVRHLSSALTDVTYVFDEPSIGLHPHDLHQMNELLLSLRDKGNTVLVIEHKPETISIADHVVDLGPGAGSRGGRICFEGTVEQLHRSDTLTGRHLADRVRLKSSHRSPTDMMRIRHAKTNNLRDVDVDIPVGVLTVITGVAGSGKSSLIHGHLSPMDGVVTIDQTPIKGSRRSNAATYTGLLDPVRKAFAKANKDRGAKPAHFSANSEGACPVCGGTGIIETQLGFMETVESRCVACEGRRFKDEVLAYRLCGRSIADVLDMSADEALTFFSQGEARLPAATRILSRLKDVGLGYLHLGQALTTLSGGERQRLKLAVHLSQEGRIIVLDEPTVGLHPADIEAMLALLDHLVDCGRSVVVIEHHEAVMAHADWIIDLGPGAGHDGGHVVFTGTPTRMVAERTTLTGRYLARYVEEGNDDTPE